MEEQRPDDILLSSRVCLSVLYVTGTAFTSSCIPSPPPSPPSSLLSPLLSPLHTQGGICSVLHAESLALGCRVLCSHSFHHSPRPPLPLVWHLPSSDLLWLFPWIQKACESNALQSASEGSVWYL